MQVPIEAPHPAMEATNFVLNKFSLMYTSKLLTTSESLDMIVKESLGQLEHNHPDIPANKRLANEKVVRDYLATIVALVQQQLGADRMN